MRTLKDKEKVLYAPFSNVGALNFEKSTGYITIPDKQVIYTRVGDDDDDNPMSKMRVQPIGAGTGQTGDEAGNEGQKMVWFLQDLQQQIDAEQIAAPQLLPGIDLKETIEMKKKGRRLYGDSVSKNELDMEDADAFEIHEKTKT